MNLAARDGSFSSSEAPGAIWNFHSSMDGVCWKPVRGSGQFCSGERSK